MREAEEKIKSPRKYKMERDAMAILRNYGWPCNVRELRHVIERLVATTMNEDITPEAVAPAMPSASQCRPDAQIPLLIYESNSLEAFIDRSFLSLYEQMMARTGSHSKLARLLNMDRSFLYQRL